jgi:ABC-type polysaccharide/polyol phosphate export permease
MTKVIADFIHFLIMLLIIIIIITVLEIESKSFHMAEKQSIH